jgi:protein SCO1
MSPLARKLIWAVIGATIALVGFLATKPPGAAEGPLPVLHEAGSFGLTNEQGRAVAAEAFRGAVCVVDVVFTRCPAQCHRLSLLMSRIQAKLPEGVHLLSLTADPVYDTPMVMSKYGAKYNQDPAKWTFLTGPKADLYRYATNSLLFTVLENPDPQAKLEDLFIHTTDFALLDKAGRLRGVVHGDEPGAATEILAMARKLLKEPSP